MHHGGRFVFFAVFTRHRMRLRTLPPKTRSAVMCTIGCRQKNKFSKELFSSCLQNCHRHYLCESHPQPVTVCTHGSPVTRIQKVSSTHLRRRPAATVCRVAGEDDTDGVIGNTTGEAHQRIRRNLRYRRSSPGRLPEGQFWSAALPCGILLTHNSPLPPHFFPSPFHPINKFL